MGFLWAVAVALGMLAGSAGPVRACASSDDGAKKVKVVRVGSDAAVCCTDAKDGKKVKVIRVGKDGRVCCADAMDGENVKVICVGDGVAYVQPGSSSEFRVYVNPGEESTHCVTIAQSAPVVAAGGPVMAYADVFAVGDDDDGPVVIKETPSRWIGVLMSPVPGPLAAHIGSDGMMIVNVVKGSPADEAGLEQYDVIVAFDDQKIDDMADLSSAVSDVEAGEQVQVVVIHDGQRRKASIAPTKRPSADEWEYKYEQPADETVDHSLNLRGHRLQMTPGGMWRMEELGPMHMVPEILEKLEGLEGLELDLRDLDMDDLDTTLDLSGQFLDDLPEGFVWYGDGKDDARVEVRIEVDDDGNVTSIHRDADGKIHVERTDADGNKSSDTYDAPEKFKKADPKSYDVYRRNSGPEAHGWYKVQPPAKAVWERLARTTRSPSRSACRRR